VIVISRAVARQFRAVLRRVLQDADQRSQWPLVLCHADASGLTLQARCGDIGVCLQQAGGQTPDTLLFRSSLLAEIEGRSDTPVELESVEATKGQARFDDGGVPRVLDFDLIVGTPEEEWPALPKKLTPQPMEFLTALYEAARTCAPAAGRFALTRVQLRGDKGEVVATDGKQLLVQRGFTLPWSEQVLIPRLSAFTCRELDGDGPIGLGRTDTHVVLRIGPWTFFLSIDANSRFPTVETVVPRATSSTSRWHVDEADAAYLLNILPKLPGSDDSHAPVTLDLDRECVLRVRGDHQEAATEAPLHASTLTGPPVRVCVNRSFLRRALQLGFRDLQVVNPDKPVVCRDARRLYVVMALDKASVIPPGRNALRLSGRPALASLSPPPLVDKSKPAAASSFPPPSVERSIPTMPAPTPNRPLANGQDTTNGNTQDPAQPPRCGIAEVIEEAEQLRTLLQEAGVRLSRLLAALKQQRRQSRAVQQAMASLKQLQLEP